MVRTALALILLTGALFLAAPLAARGVEEIKLGDTLTEDIITPVALTVIDPEATDALKLKEETRTPIILRFDPTATDKAEDALRTAFGEQRSNFLNAVEAAYNRQKLSDATIAAAKFQKLIGSYNKRNKGLTLTTNLAESWARGDSGRVVQAELITRVREAMAHPIRPGAWPEEFKSKLSYNLRLVPMSNAEEVVTLEMAERRGANTKRTEMFTLARARTNLQARFPADEKGFAKFAAAALRPNYFIDLELTRQSRALHMEGLLSADNYAVGQVIARNGQVVDRKIMAALDQLHEKTSPVQLQEQITVQHAEAEQVQRRSEWLIAGLGTATALSVLVIWRLTRRRTSMALVPVKGGGIAVPGDGEAMIASAEVRAGLMAQLTHVFRQKLVRGLISQRGTMLATQRIAAAEMADLERRLSQLQAPLQERLRAYENRIMELEKALAAKGDENRELIKAKIQLVRKQLEAERSKNRLVLN